eukprot:TRINITY_DN5240_c0_g1_i15.p1 TRINITY_DN5240_c0_g1~~TRINITY_DN5240_c0_g1_i15.p1  ORF type:complete len:176 (-),score=45.35 TRINITY_DN5240_c0_g1_i15:1051-1578(-)
MCIRDRNNYEVFIKNLEVTLSSLGKKYLGSTRAVFDSESGKDNAANAVSDIAFKSHKTEAVLMFELFCELMKHILGTCTNKKAFLLLLEVLNKFMQEIRKNFKGAFEDEVADTHYMKQFDKGYYEFERNSSAFSSLEYPFLYLPIGNLSKDLDLSAHSVLWRVRSSRRATRSGRR